MLQYVTALLQPLPFQTCEGWQRNWSGRSKGWVFPNAVWVKCSVPKKLDVTKLNRRWVHVNSEDHWKQTWKKVWRGRTVPNMRVFIWLLLNHRFFTNRQGSHWGVSDGICSRCNSHFEHTEHLFFRCRNVIERWREVQHRLQGTPALNAH